MTKENTILFETLSAQSGLIALVTLNSEKTLNALDLNMAQEMRKKLNEWEADPKIQAVFIRGKGRAFCAGGDIRSLYNSIQEKTPYLNTFFEEEYRLDFKIHSFKKPLIVWGQGFVMGGGMGIQQGAGLRIGTESTKMALPELGIGLFPDVGASYFLRKCPQNWGLFFGLTGLRIDAFQAQEWNLLDLVCADDSQTKALEMLQSFMWTGSKEQDLQSLKTLFQEICIQNEEKAHAYKAYENFYSKLTAHTEASSLMNWIEKIDSQGKWEELAKSYLQKASPSSIGIFLEQMKRGKSLSLAECFQMEWEIACQCALHPDFAEGVRALIVDKDMKPQWNPATAQELSHDWILEHFTPPHLAENPLKNLEEN